MDNEKIGQFICELRKSKKMTQKDLATQLNITDKAVSKWERGLSYPDISLLASIADVLGVTTSELLNGEKNSSSCEDVEGTIDNALHYADKTAKNRLKSVQGICAMAFSFLLFIGIVVCAICDLAISGAFTWSLFPISSIIFAWLVLFPVIKYGAKGIFSTLISISVLIIPYLYVLDNLIKSSDLILPIGIRMSFISVVFLWCLFVLFKRMKTRKLFATAITLVVSIPVYVLINYILSKLISEPIIDVWDVLSFSIIAIVAMTFFILDYMARKSRPNSSEIHR